MDLNKVGKQIKKESWDIIESWIGSVLNDSQIDTPHHIQKNDLINGMPVVLLAVSKNISKPIENELSRKGIFGLKVSSQSKIRFNQGYSLPEIFREYAWLREHILLHLRKKETINKANYLLHSRIDKAIDEQLLNAVETYSDNYIKELKKSATVDPLTELFNRRAFFDILHKELRRAKRYSHPISLMLLDLDNFKQLNDNFGHLAGDKYLKDFSTFLSEQSRATDFVARLGGDEFALILTETSLSQATQVLRRIQDSFYTRRELVKDNVGVSIGIGINGTSSPIEMYNAADKSLIKAKWRKDKKIKRDFKEGA